SRRAPRRGRMRATARDPRPWTLDAAIVRLPSPHHRAQERIQARWKPLPFDGPFQVVSAFRRTVGSRTEPVRLKPDPTETWPDATETRARFVDSSGTRSRTLRIRPGR